MEEFSLKTHVLSNITELPSNMFNNLSKLKKLSLNISDLEELPKSMIHLISLESLYIESKKLKILPKFFSSFTKLKEISFNNTNNIYLQEFFKKFNKLESIYLKNINLLKFDKKDILFNLDLRSLTIIHCKLNKDINVINNLVNLENLVLSNLTFVIKNNHLENKILNFQLLKVIKLIINAAIDVITINFPQSLQELSISEFFTDVSLPNGKDQFINLEYLYLECINCVQKMGKIPKLKTAFINSKGSSFPFDPSDLQNLELIFLKNSEISELPEEFLKLSKLEFLGFQDSPYLQLKDNLESIASLKYIYLINSSKANFSSSKIKIIENNV